MKKVSIIIPTYKRNDFILRALDSVLSQDYPALEVIVVDDNGLSSPDQLATQEKLLSYIADGKLIYLPNETNLGGCKARNRGILAATGDYVTFLDDDDVYLPRKISVQVEAMEKNGWDLCMMDDATYCGAQRLSHKIQPFDSGMPQQEILKAHITKHITGTNVFMFRRQKLLQIGMFDEIPAGQEFMLMLKAINANLNIGCIHEVFVHCHMDGQERISSRLSKVDGMKLIYAEKKKYFSILSHKERAYIRSKHHGTLFYIYYVNRKYFPAAAELLKAFFCSPQSTWETYQERKGKLKGSRSRNG